MVESSPSRQRRSPCKTNKGMSDEAAEVAALTYLLTVSTDTGPKELACALTTEPELYSARARAQGGTTRYGGQSCPDSKGVTGEAHLGARITKHSRRPNFPLGSVAGHRL